MSHVVSAIARRFAGLVGSVLVAGIIALALAGIPFTICRLCCPPGNADTLKAAKSVICAGAAHETLEACVGAEGVVGGAGITVTMSVTVDMGAETVIVIGGSIKTYVVVVVSVAVSVSVGGMTKDASGSDIDSVEVGSMTEKINPSIVVARESIKEASAIGADCVGVA